MDRPTPEQVATLYRGRLVSFATRYVGASDAEDVVQDALLVVVRKIDRFDGSTSGVYSWVCAITRNLCLDLLRSRKVRDRNLHLIPWSCRLNGFAPAEDDPVELAVMGEVQASLDAAMEEMRSRPNFLRAMTARLSGERVEETARRMGKSKPNVQNYLNRARVRIRENL